jgi:ribosomal protein S18 acetylase RimI-like enzyme
MDEISLSIAGPEELDALLPLVVAYHAFESIVMTDKKRRLSVEKLIGDGDLGAIWGVKNRDGLVGYIALCFGYSIEFGGRDAFIDEFYLTPEVRGQGIGGDVLKLVKSKATALGVGALHLEVARDNRRARSLYERHGFKSRDLFSLMSVALLHDKERA